MDLQGKVVVVTGVANPRGIGLALATAYASAGAKIVLADISAEGAEISAQKLRAQGAECVSVPVNMSVISEVRALADRTYDSFGGTDLLFLNHAAWNTNAIYWWRDSRNSIQHHRGKNSPDATLVVNFHCHLGNSQGGGVILFRAN